MKVKIPYTDTISYKYAAYKKTRNPFKKIAYRIAFFIWKDFLFNRLLPTLHKKDVFVKEDLQDFIHFMKAAIDPDHSTRYIHFSTTSKRNITIDMYGSREETFYITIEQKYFADRRYETSKLSAGKGIGEGLYLYIVDILKSYTKEESNYETFRKAEEKEVLLNDFSVEEAGD